MLPKYKLIDKKGPAHNPIITISLSVKGINTIYSSGSTKKKAEQSAAAILLDILDEKNC